MISRFYHLSFLTAFLLCTASVTFASTIAKTLEVQVYDICNDDGNNCASRGPVGDDYFANEVNTIWAQANISVTFNLVQRINSTLFSNINDAINGYTFADLTSAYGTHGASSKTVDLFLTHTIINTNNNLNVYGEGWLGFGGIVIGMDTVMSYNNGSGRVDTIAHELGHNFGLVPTSIGGDGTGHSTNPTYLMTGGQNRLIPTSTGDIGSNGLGYDLLPSDHIALARSSSLLSDAVVVAPEPATWALLLIGGVGLGIRRRA